jgi:hypothetical protein
MLSQGKKVMCARSIAVAAGMVAALHLHVSLASPAVPPVGVPSESPRAVEQELEATVPNGYQISDERAGGGVVYRKHGRLPSRDEVARGILGGGDQTGGRAGREILVSVLNVLLILIGTAVYLKRRQARS